MAHLLPSKPPSNHFLTPTTFSYSHYNLLNNVKVYMHEGSKRTRGDRAEGWKDLHNRAISLSIWSCVYNLPLLLPNADLSDCLTDPMPHHPHQPPQNNLALTNNSIYFVSVSVRMCMCLSLSVYFSVRLYELTRALCSPRRINQASAT